MRLFSRRYLITTAMIVAMALPLSGLSASDGLAASYRTHRHASRTAHSPKRLRYAGPERPPAPAYQPNEGDPSLQPGRQQAPARNTECSTEFPAANREGLYRDNVNTQRPCF